MATLISRSPAETERLGEDLGRQARPGWVFGLTGDLGAGKTRLVKGLARGLGVRGPIQSPSFGLVREHRDGRLPLFHLDLYRLEGVEQILAAGLGDYFEPRDGVSVIEWYERWRGPDAPRLVRVRLRHAGDGEDMRLIEYDCPWP